MQFKKFSYLGLCRIIESKDMLSWKGPTGIIGSSSWPCARQPKIHVPESTAQFILDRGWKNLIKTLPLLTLHPLLKIFRNRSCHSSSYKCRSLPSTETSSLHYSGSEACLLKAQPFLIAGLALPIYYTTSFTKEIFPATDTSFIIENIQRNLGTSWNCYRMICCWKNYGFSST